VSSACLLAALAATPAQGQSGVLGHRDCEKCHRPAIRKWSQDEPRELGGDAHFNTAQQLQDPKAQGYAAAIGLGNPADPAGRCAECHATVVRGRVRSGVSCESCHGPARRYVDVHDKQPYAESYRKSLPLGLADLHQKPAAIARKCVSCHVTPEPALAAAGHPRGDDFDAGRSLQKIVHWTAAFTPDGSTHASYDYAQISAAGRQAVSQVGSGRAAPQSTAPVTASAPAPAPVPWDWDQPVPELPADYPSEDARRDEPAPAAVAPASIVEDLPVARDDLPPTRPDPEPAPALPATAKLAELRGRAAVLLADQLRAGRRAPDLPQPEPPAEYQGPDGELLHIQDVVLYLVLETLRKPE
jgi:hypothetical protein